MARVSEAPATARRSRGFKQPEIPRRPGGHPNTVSAIERRRTGDPGYFTVMAIADALGVRPDELWAFVRDGTPIEWVGVGEA
jgi:transcriptional regulator with XRE-family HTH domain